MVPGNFLNQAYFPSISGPFRWTEAGNTVLLREVLTLEPFLYKIGIKEAGQKWTATAETVNHYNIFREIPRDQRSVREQFNKLLKDFKRKINSEERASGINPDPLSENEAMLDEIVERMDSTPLKNDNAELGKKEENKRKEALDARDKAMTTWSKAGKSADRDSDSDDESECDKPVARRGRKRRSTSDPFQCLAEKTAKETEMRREELEVKKQELQMQAELQKQQFDLQQAQIKQMLENQTNTQNLVLALINKIAK